MLRLLTNLFSAWSAAPPEFARRAPRQRVESAYLWLLALRAQCPSSTLRALHIVPGENAGQKRRPAVVVHCQSATSGGNYATGDAGDLYACELQIHVEGDFKARRGANGWDQHRAALVLGEIADMMASQDTVRSLLNTDNIAERPFGPFHLVRHVEGVQIGLPLGGSSVQDTLSYTVWMHPWDNNSPWKWEDGSEIQWDDGEPILAESAT